MSLVSITTMLVMISSCLSLIVVFAGRNEQATCFHTPRNMFVVVLCARVKCHIGSRMHLHTGAYVTTKKPHVRARRHSVMCRSSVAGLGPQAPCGIRPRLLTNPEPHTWLLRALRPLRLARGRIMAGIWACGHAASCSRRGPLPAQAQAENRPEGIGTSSANTSQGQQGDGQGNKAPSEKQCRRRWTAAAVVQAGPGAMHSSRTRQREPQPGGNRAVLVCL